jgi:peptidoglycan/LPS O-acetylase OafA/YrhL
MGTVRFLLALSVVVAHSPSDSLLGVHFLNASTAVQAFYVISGFLITMVLNERTEYKSARNFYLSRYLRLWPTYIVVAALALCLFRWSAFNAAFLENNFITVAFVAISNLTLLFQDWSLFLEIDQGSLVPTIDFHAGPTPALNDFLLVPQAWTLGVELTFYLLAPLICRRRGRLAALFSAGLCVRLALGAWQPPLDPWCYRFAPAEMMLFSAGGLSYFIGKYVHARLSRPVIKSGPALCLAIVVITIVDVPYVTPFLHRLLGTSFLPLLWLPFPGILLLITLTCPVLFIGWRKVAWDGLVGELSYPIYISHMFVFESLRRLVPGAALTGNVLYVASTIAFSALLLFMVVLPVNRIRARFGARIPVLHRLQPATSIEGT